MGTSSSKLKLPTVTNYNPQTLKLPFQSLITKPLTSHEKRLVYFIIYYLSWLELPLADFEGLRSRYRAYRHEVTSLISPPDPQNAKPGQYQRIMEKDIARIRDRIKIVCHGTDNMKICMTLLKAVEESFRYGHMPPKFGEIRKMYHIAGNARKAYASVEERGVVSDEFGGTEGFEGWFEEKQAIVRPVEIYRPRKERIRVGSPLSNLKSIPEVPKNNEKGEVIERVWEVIDVDKRHDQTTQDVDLVIKAKLNELEVKMALMEIQRNILIQAQNRVQNIGKIEK